MKDESHRREMRWGVGGLVTQRRWGINETQRWSGTEAVFSLVRRVTGEGRGLAALSRLWLRRCSS